MDIRALGCVVLERTDPARWEHFATQVAGLGVSPALREDGVLSLKTDDYAWRLRVVNGSQDRFLCAGWELAGAQAFADAIRELDAAGIAWRRASAQDCAARRVEEMLSFTAPGGLDCELFRGMVLDYLPPAAPAGSPRFVTGYHGNMGLGHIACATPDLAASHRFFTQVMGCLARRISCRCICRLTLRIQDRGCTSCTATIRATTASHSSRAQRPCRAIWCT